ncbi:T9SS type A sorting domain-containing protein [Subsaxibacter sp. CAU 1640]|uniref:T9SS type A sorting domain-containing protein n=1 Tax=Subsaxibacter sp. CAU 1640 TaxID=2933271 RepID=UPI00200505F4|nr:T9SS type A sorting domain-containing protein [Subsaxibacter sp. CAU 1640]MCK7589146.1 T9SS type A sorting domain-containing protein [Subsaxibacter sp. CAU 1640]
MKNSLFYFCFFICLCLQAQIINIPDQNFKNALIAAGIDSNGDNQIQVSEAEQVTNLGSYMIGQSISSIEGIEFFINLTQLNVAGNQLTTINGVGLENLTNLTNINCIGNQIESIDITNFPTLYTLWCSDNPLSEINLGASDVFSYLLCSNTLLESIDFTTLPNGSALVCDNMPLLASINIKNGADISGCCGNWYLQFDNCPNLNYICADESELYIAEYLANVYGYTSLTIDSNCGNLGVPEVDTNGEISIFPNPTNGLITIESSFILDKIIVYDMFGREVTSNKNRRTNDVQIRLDDLPSGIYILKLGTSNGEHFKRILKK